jgi:cation transport ATPase
VIRPDYVTAPRLSAELSALHGIAQGAQQGIFFRNPAALDHLALVDVYVFDDTAGLDRRRLEVATVRVAHGVAEALVASYALTASAKPRDERGRALSTIASSLTAPYPNVEPLRHHAGVTRYRDSSGNAIEVATAEYVSALKIEVPKSFELPLSQPSKASDGRKDIHDDEAALRPLWVLRNGQVIGAVSFARSGELVGKQLVASIKTNNKRARFVYLSRDDESRGRALAEALGIDLSYGDLGQEAKANLIRGLGRQTLWVGDGTDLDNRQAIAASTVSVSVARYRHSPQDVADILLPQKGLDALPAAIELGRAHELRLARDYKTVYAANAAGVGGAFFARFNSLQTGLLSNVGTGIIYARRARALDRLEHRTPRSARTRSAI